LNLTNRINRLNEEANKMLRSKRSDTLVLLVPWDNERGWIIDACHDYKTGEENTMLKNRLEACQTFDDIAKELDGYTTNVPEVGRSGEFK